MAIRQTISMWTLVNTIGYPDAEKTEGMHSIQQMWKSAMKCLMNTELKYEVCQRTNLFQNSMQKGNIRKPAYNNRMNLTRFSRVRSLA
jgi:hypothetical protein